MKTKIETINRYFDEQIAACAARSQALLADDRTDESNFEKIRANVYDIFRTMLSSWTRLRKSRTNSPQSGGMRNDGKRSDSPFQMPGR